MPVRTLIAVEISLVAVAVAVAVVVLYLALDVSWSGDTDSGLPAGETMTATNGASPAPLACLLG